MSCPPPRFGPFKSFDVLLLPLSFRVADMLHYKFSPASFFSPPGLLFADPGIRAPLCLPNHKLPLTLRRGLHSRSIQVPPGSKVKRSLSVCPPCTGPLHSASLTCSFRFSPGVSVGFWVPFSCFCVRLLFLFSESLALLHVFIHVLLIPGNSCASLRTFGSKAFQNVWIFGALLTA